MSMLSAQCDELRNLAGDGSVEFVAGPIRADVLRMAADTIWELRCKLNDEQDGNVKMREQMEFDRQMSRSRAKLIDRLKAENAKLRELLVGAFEDMNAWQRVIACSNEWGYGKGSRDQLCKLRDAMQELGMEVVV